MWSSLSRSTSGADVGHTKPPASRFRYHVQRSWGLGKQMAVAEHRPTTSWERSRINAGAPPIALTIATRARRRRPLGWASPAPASKNNQIEGVRSWAGDGEHGWVDRSVFASAGKYRAGARRRRGCQALQVGQHRVGVGRL